MEKDDEEVQIFVEKEQSLEGLVEDEENNSEQAEI